MKTDAKQPVLFSPLRLRGLTLPNRIVVSPMCQYSADDGCATDWHLMHLGGLAVAGYGMVIIEATAVNQQGRITPSCLGLYSDAGEAALARVVDFCKQHGAAKIGIQLAHSGRKGSRLVPWQGRGPLADGAWPIVAPSPIAESDALPVPGELGDDELAGIHDAFVEAAQRADRIGIDAIELHMAHGYLLHQFLSPLSNRRDDALGGSRDNRMRFPLAIFGAVRDTFPSHKPVGVRFSAGDGTPDGWTAQDAAAFAAELERRGCDFLDISSGGIPAGPKEVGAAYQLPRIAALREATKLPMIAVGNIDDPRTAERIVASRQAELIGLGRAALNDPRWPWRAARALGASGAYPPPYTRCAPDAWNGEPFVVELPLPEKLRRN